MTQIALALLPLVSALAVPPRQTAARTVMPAMGSGWYVGNAAPLTPSPYLKLPIGAIKPLGWLRKQLELEANGFVGHLDQVSGFLKKDGNAWLSPTGAGANPWEELPYWLKGFGDLGYVLGDRRIVDEARIWLEGAFGSRRSTGYFGPESNLTNADGKTDLWPNMLMVNALQSYYEFSGDRRVIALLDGYFKWQASIPDAEFLTPNGAGTWQNQRAGDNLASVYWLYNRTKESWLLQLAAKIHRCAANWTAGVASWHGVNFAQCFREPATYFQQAKQLSLLRATDADYAKMRGIYGQVPGGMYGADENARSGYTGPRQATETCSFVEMMSSDEQLVEIAGDLTWADRCEDVAYNSLPASMTADLKALRYLTAPNLIQSDAKSKSPDLQNGGPMLHYDPYDHRCCQHNVAMGWPYFAETLWMATPDRGLTAMFYAQSEVKAKVGAGRTVTVKEDTKYPFREDVRFTIETSAPVAFPLYLRVPAWCRAPKLSLNGKPLKIASGLGNLIAVNRRWRGGDKLSLTLPMTVVLTQWTANDDSISINRGPLTYSLKIGERYVRLGGTNKWPAWEVYPTTAWNYGLSVGDPRKAITAKLNAWPADDQPFKWNAAPIELTAYARKIPGWKKDYLGVVGNLRPSPIRSTQPLEKITLIQMGCARLRIASFPTVSVDARAHEWPIPKDPLPASASFANNSDPISALSDGILPSKSFDQSIPRFTWWDHLGTAEWVQYDFERPRTVSNASVYWFDDSGSGRCRVPASWKITYLDGNLWREVPNHSAYGVERDKFNTVTFDPVVAAKLRIEVQLKPGFSGGILEWQIK